MAGTVARRSWSRCSKCGQCEYNDVLEEQMGFCMNCGSTVELYKARGRAVRFADTVSTDQVVNDWKGDASLVHPKGILRSRSQSPQPGAGRGKRGKAGGKG
eukprot:1144090-Pyramimonas_sp.AAC.1